MRPEVLVRRADQDVHVPVAHVDRPVRSVVHRVRPGERARIVRKLDDATHVRHRADGVGRDGEGHDASSIGEQPLEVVEVERRVVMDVDESHGQILVVGELEPRRYVRVVVELRDDDLVAGFPRPAGGARQREVQRRHVRAEDGFVRRAAEEVPGCHASLRDEPFGAPARLVWAADVRIRVAEVGRHGINHRVGNLRPAGPVEERERLAQSGEARADRLDVERHR